MKKVILISSAVVIGSLSAVLFTSCDRGKEGVYGSKEAKISKIYFEHYILTDGKKTVPQEKVLFEVWKWDKQKLMQIQSMASDYPWTLYFTYKGNQVQEITSGNDVFKFIYDDKSKKLKKIEVVDDLQRPTLNIMVDNRDNEDKITKLTYEQFTYTEVPNEKVLISKFRPIVYLMIGNDIGETMVKNMEENAKMQKKTNTTKVTTQIELTYNGGNVSEEKRTITREGSDKPEVILTKYKYDDKINPYYHALCLMFDSYSTPDNDMGDRIFMPLASSSENNVMSFFSYNLNAAKPEIAIDSAVYLYKYNNVNFPTERDKTVKMERIDHLGNVVNIEEHKIYYYEYITK